MSKIRFVRQLRGYSQEYMAKKLGIPQNTYSRYETNPSKLPEEVLNRLASELGISKEDLLNQEPFVINIQNTGGTNGYFEAEKIEINSKEIFEKFLESKQEEIKLLKSHIIDLKEQIVYLKEKK